MCIRDRLALSPVYKGRLQPLPLSVLNATTRPRPYWDTVTIGFAVSVLTRSWAEGFVVTPLKPEIWAERLRPSVMKWLGFKATTLYPPPEEGASSLSPNMISVSYTHLTLPTKRIV